MHTMNAEGSDVAVLTKDRVGAALAILAGIVGLVLVFSGSGNGDDDDDAPGATPPTSQVGPAPDGQVQPGAPGQSGPAGPQSTPDDDDDD